MPKIPYYNGEPGIVLESDAGTILSAGPDCWFYEHRPTRGGALDLSLRTDTLTAQALIHPCGRKLRTATTS